MSAARCQTPPAPTADAIRHVEQMQQDGLLLLAHLAENAERAFVADPATGRGASQDLADPTVLGLPPQDVVLSADRFRTLLQTVDVLSRAAAPATTTSIRLTCAYLKGATPDVGEVLLGQAKAVRYWVNGVRIALVLAVGLAVWLLMHVDEGRRATNQLAAVRADLDRTYADLAKLDRKTDFALTLYLPNGVGNAPPKPAEPLDYCWPVDKDMREAVPFREPVETVPASDSPPQPSPFPGDQPAEGAWHLTPIKVQSQNVCSLLWQQKTREQLVYSRLTTWNCLMARLNPLVAAESLVWDVCAESPELQPPAGPGDWQRTELRTSDGIAQLTGYILPLLLGGIGGCVFVLRRLEDRVRNFTLTATDGVSSVVRIILASTFGGLLGAIFGTDAPVALGGYTLSLAAAAFFVGYGLETVLATVDRLIKAVMDAIHPKSDADKQVRVG